MPGTEHAEFFSTLDVRDEDVIVTKRRYDPFYATDLEVVFSNNNISSLYLAGVNTHLCVLAGAFGAVCRDYEVTVLSDCTAASSLAAHNSGLDVLSTVADEVRPSTEIEVPPL
jgi:nicotinamidase-related amidase